MANSWPQTHSQGSKPSSPILQSSENCKEKSATIKYVNLLFSHFFPKMKRLRTRNRIAVTLVGRITVSLNGCTLDLRRTFVYYLCFVGKKAELYDILSFRTVKCMLTYGSMLLVPATPMWTNRFAANRRDCELLVVV